MAQGEATRAESVSQLGSPSLLSLIRPWQCQSPPEVRGSGVSCRVAWSAEMFIVRKPRSQQPRGDAGDSQGLGRCLFQQIP